MIGFLDKKKMLEISMWVFVVYLILGFGAKIGIAAAEELDQNQLTERISGLGLFDLVYYLWEYMFLIPGVEWVWD